MPYYPRCESLATEELCTEVNAWEIATFSADLDRREIAESPVGTGFGDEVCTWSGSSCASPEPCSFETVRKGTVFNELRPGNAGMMTVMVRTSKTNVAVSASLTFAMGMCIETNYDAAADEYCSHLFSSSQAGRRLSSKWETDITLYVFVRADNRGLESKPTRGTLDEPNLLVGAIPDTLATDLIGGQWRRQSGSGSGQSTVWQFESSTAELHDKGIVSVYRVSYFPGEPSPDFSAAAPDDSVGDGSVYFSVYMPIKGDALCAHGEYTAGGSSAARATQDYTTLDADCLSTSEYESAVEEYKRTFSYSLTNGDTGQAVYGPGLLVQSSTEMDDNIGTLMNTLGLVISILVCLCIPCCAGRYLYKNKDEIDEKLADAKKKVAERQAKLNEDETSDRAWDCNRITEVFCACSCINPAGAMKVLRESVNLPEFLKAMQEDARKNGEAAAERHLAEQAEQAQKGLSARLTANGRVRMKVLSNLLFRSFALILSLVRAIFNVSLVHTSLKYVTSVPTWPEIQHSLELTLPGFHLIGQLAFDIAAPFDITSTTSNWNCQGAKSFGAVLANVITLALCVLILEKDLLLRLHFFIQMHAHKRKGETRSNIIKVGAALVGGTLYLMQLFVSVGGSMFAASLSSESTETCSDADENYLVASKFFLYAIAVPAVVVIFVIFAGSLSGTYGQEMIMGLLANPCFMMPAMVLTFGYGAPFAAYGVAGLFNIVSVTFGLWTPALVEAYGVNQRSMASKATLERGKRASMVEVDDQSEEVAMLLGRSRGLVWMAIPGCAILAKIAEALNSSTPFTCEAIKSTTCRPRRFLEYLFNFFEFGMVLAVVFEGTIGAVFMLFASLWPNWLLQTFAELQALAYEFDSEGSLYSLALLTFAVKSAKEQETRVKAHSSARSMSTTANPGLVQDNRNPMHDSSSSSLQTNQSDADEVC
jgi:hypothetical protein